MERRLVIDCLGFVKNRAFGFQEYLFNILDYFYSHRNDLHFSEIIIACKPSEIDSFGKYKDLFSIRPVSFSETYLGRLVQQTLLHIRLNLHKNDLILFPGNFSGLLKHCNHVLVIHDLLFKHKDLLRKKWMIRQREFYIPRSIKLADKIICISQFTSNEVAYFYPESSNKLSTIYNYINFGKYTVDVDNTDNNYFLVVAANSYHKDLGTVFYAFEKYVSKGGDKNLVIVGEVKEDSEAGKVYMKLSDKVKGRIDFKINISNNELGLIYQHASAFISSSRYEGFGLPIAEAMFFNLPIILTDIEIHREVSMRKALFYNERDNAQLCNIMLTSDLHRQNYYGIKERYGDNNTSFRYVQLLNEVYSKE